MVWGRGYEEYNYFLQCQRCRFGSCSEEDQHSDLNHLKLSNFRETQTLENLDDFVAMRDICYHNGLASVGEAKRL